ncbi:Outer-membrane lipoprotein carrier protein precursor [Marinomonas aquimarina]|uniref:Outer-membrane lipoprotein carrier protein n=1 Tax=Marinomonas aquimarina TaxID=295068 RepID=A0A1A8T5B0_9GAMM|nr:outer membrane lipoprotein chaperone LolA [Marinomonas aquimarina]SBS26770.1 Outer-membrane lipoprotein carrier protein precursor [Marinomonas aquimarina]
MARIMFSLGLLLAFNVSAEVPAEQLSQLLEHNRNVEGEFRQATYNERGDQVQNSEGVFLLAAPNRFVWDTITPFPQRIISDGEWVTIWDVDLEQATRKPFAGSVGNSPAALLGNSADNALNHYRVSKTDSDSFQLEPLEQEDLFDTLTLSFDQDYIRTMRIKDVLGQTTVIEFANVEAHEGVSEQNFIVDLPESVDLIIEQ